MNRIGIMGGTFNPIHNSHILLGLQAKSLLQLDKVLFMPSNNPPHKEIHDYISDEDRCYMVKLSLEGLDGMEFSDIEFQREGLTYTSDTLDIVCKENPDCRFYFIIGGDSVAYFDKWHLPDHILRNCALVCASRGDTDDDVIKQQINALRDMFTSDAEGEEFIPEVYYLKAPEMNVSSTIIRNLSACGLSVSGLVPEAVAEYIKTKGLYQHKNLNEAKEDLISRLTPHRYRHTIGVAEFAAKLALSHNYDIIQAYTAGLLHDSAKSLSEEESISEAERFGIVPSKYERKNANNLLHGKIAAYYLSERYGIDDKVIFDSIYYHTTGHTNMSVLDKIIYLSDTLEYGRTMQFTPSLDIIRGVATSDLDLALYYVLNNIVPYLIKEYGDEMDPIQYDVFDEVKSKVKIKQ